MSEVLIAALAAAAGSVLTVLGKVIVSIIKARKEPDQTEIAKLTHNEKTEGALSQIQESLQDFTGRQTVVNQLLLRREIFNIYLTYFRTQEIPEREFESVLNLYTVYKDIGGNGVASEYVEEIKTWKRV